MSSNSKIRSKFMYNLTELVNLANSVFFILIFISVCTICIVGLEWPIIPLDAYKSTSRIGSVLLNLSYSFMAAFFFWFCTDYIVERHKQSKILASCQPLLDEINGIMAYMKELMSIVEEGGKVVNKITGKNGKVFVEKHYNIEYNCFAMGLQKYNDDKSEYGKDIYSMYSFPIEIMQQFNLLDNNIDEILNEKERLPKYLIYLLVNLKKDNNLMHLPVFLKMHLQQPNREVGFNLPGKIYRLVKWEERLKPYIKTNITYKLTKYDKACTESIIKEIKDEMYRTGDIWKNYPCVQQSGLLMYPNLENLMEEYHETINHNNQL